MTIIDSQVHAYEANTPKRPWHTCRTGPLTSPATRWWRRWTRSASTARSSSPPFRCTATTPAMRWKCKGPSRPVRHRQAGRPGRSGGRRCHRRLEEDAGHGRHPHHADRRRTSATRTIRASTGSLRAAVRHDFPVNILCWDNIDAGTALIDRYPDTRFIIDHLGILQPRTPPAPPQPWADLPKVLELARRPNAVIKVSGACTLSQRAVSVPGHLGPARAHIRCLGFRSLPVGHRLDARLRRRQLRAGRRAFPQDDRLSDS